MIWNNHGIVSSASFQLLNLETGTRVGLFSLPHPLHPPSASPADAPGPILPSVPAQAHHPCQATLLGGLAQPWSPAGVGNSALEAFPPVSTQKSFQTSNQIKDRLLELPKTSNQAWDEISTLSRVSRGLLWPGPAGPHVSSSEPGRAIWASVYRFEGQALFRLVVAVLQGLLPSQPLALCSPNLFSCLGCLPLL